MCSSCGALVEEVRAFLRSQDQGWTQDPYRRARVWWPVPFLGPFDHRRTTDSAREGGFHGNTQVCISLPRGTSQKQRGWVPRPAVRSDLETGDWAQ